jgi:hypothetical protein
LLFRGVSNLNKIGYDIIGAYFFSNF